MFKPKHSIVKSYSYLFAFFQCCLCCVAFSSFWIGKMCCLVFIHYNLNHSWFYILSFALHKNSPHIFPQFVSVRERFALHDIQHFSAAHTLCNIYVCQRKQLFALFQYCCTCSSHYGAFTAWHNWLVLQHNTPPSILTTNARFVTCYDMNSKFALGVNLTNTLWIQTEFIIKVP